MSYFKYKGYDKDGRVIEDSIDSASKDSAVKVIQEQGIFITKISQIKKKASESLLDKSKIKKRDVVVFTRMLSTMVNADMPIIEGLDISIEQLPEGRLRHVVRRIINDIKSGKALSEALAAHPKIFSKLYIAMVKAGEASGKLGKILEQLFSFMERMESLKRKITSAMIYPSIVMFVSVSIISVFFLVLIPKFKENFSDMGDKLPSITKAVFSFSDFYSSYFHYFAIFMIVVIVVFIRLIKTKKGRYYFDSLKLKFPFKVGTLIKKVVLVRVTRTLGTLMGNGVPVIEALDIVTNASGNVIMENLLIHVKRKISSGERLASTLSKSSLIPKMMIQMISMGEESGQLPEMLDKVSQFYDSDVDIAVERLVSAITPIVIIFLAIFVAIILVALFMPISNMIQIAG
ncbi:MAG: type II secretion system F family protein [Spirochaetes bacterium]|nr:type II secretion system F family protein [Spirochaetota bacterium]